MPGNEPSSAVQCSPSPPPTPRYRAGVSAGRPPSRWRFASPSLLLLSLLTVPFPWVEVRCNKGRNAPARVHRQAGVQILLDRQTDIDQITGIATTRQCGFTAPVRCALAWVWTLSAGIGVILGFLARDFAVALAHLVCSCAGVLLLAALEASLWLGHLLSHVRLLPAFGLAFVACVAAAAFSAASCIQWWDAWRLEDL